MQLMSSKAKIVFGVLALACALLAPFTWSHRATTKGFVQVMSSSDLAVSMDHLPSSLSKIRAGAIDSISVHATAKPAALIHKKSSAKAAKAALKRAKSHKGDLHRKSHKARSKISDPDNEFENFQNTPHDEEALDTEGQNDGLQPPPLTPSSSEEELNSGRQSETRERSPSLDDGQNDGFQSPPRSPSVDDGERDNDFQPRDQRFSPRSPSLDGGEFQSGLEDEHNTEDSENFDPPEERPDTEESLDNQDEPLNEVDASAVPVVPTQQQGCNRARVTFIVPANHHWPVSPEIREEYEPVPAITDGMLIYSIMKTGRADDSITIDCSGVGNEEKLSVESPMPGFSGECEFVCSFNEEAQKPQWNLQQLNCICAKKKGAVANEEETTDLVTEPTNVTSGHASPGLEHEGDLFHESREHPIVDQEELQGIWMDEQNGRDNENWKAGTATNCLGRYVYVEYEEYVGISKLLATKFTKAKKPSAEECEAFGDPAEFTKQNKVGFNFEVLDADMPNWEKMEPEDIVCEGSSNPHLAGKGLKLFQNTAKYKVLVPTQAEVDKKEHYSCDSEHNGWAPCSKPGGDLITPDTVLVKGSAANSVFIKQTRDRFNEYYVECAAGEDTQHELEELMSDPPGPPSGGSSQTENNTESMTAPDLSEEERRTEKRCWYDQCGAGKIGAEVWEHLPTCKDGPLKRKNFENFNDEVAQILQTNQTTGDGEMTQKEAEEKACLSDDIDDETGKRKTKYYDIYEPRTKPEVDCEDADGAIAQGATTFQLEPDGPRYTAAGCTFIFTWRQSTRGSNEGEFKCMPDYKDVPAQLCKL
eukprot:gnl/MRDRNA2_/MRDRNA2_104010_c0_seq1.p1 gnl/MRDRNA2_/MRDRNA2_104010_c0~~gnl/MRDRNA2_/MRDRNA2_104010_c0_seq1.p1  ORF type:complete len:816 (-),score=151.89 gnl/MRDRNA2_/MRDRNA2_104010_c0_seq1:42-2489(-)